jgi:hypothetical protein
MSADDKVGYKNPPTASRFKKGQCGNRKGRPKGSRNLKTDLEAELGETILVSEGGSRKTVSKQRAMLKSLTAKALQGDARAASTILGLVQKLLADEGRGLSHEELATDDRAILEAYEERVRRRLLAERGEAQDD